MPIYKKTIIIILLLSFIFSISYAQIFTPEEEKQPIQEARRDAKKSGFPVLWAITSCFSSCLLPVLINRIIVINSIATPENTALTSIICCLGTTLLAYLIAPKVPQDKIKDESADYKKAYSNAYKKELRKNNALATCITGATGFVAAILIIGYMFSRMFPSV